MYHVPLWTSHCVRCGGHLWMEGKDNTAKAPSQFPFPSKFPSSWQERVSGINTSRAMLTFQRSGHRWVETTPASRSQSCGPQSGEPGRPAPASWRAASPGTPGPGSNAFWRLDWAWRSQCSRRLQGAEGEIRTWLHGSACRRMTSLGGLRASTPALANWEPASSSTQELMVCEQISAVITSGDRWGGTGGRGGWTGLKKHVWDKQGIAQRSWLRTRAGQAAFPEPQMHWSIYHTFPYLLPPSPFIHYLRSYIHSFIHLFTHTLVPLFTHLSLHSFLHSFVHPLILSFCYSLM